MVLGLVVGGEFWRVWFERSDCFCEWVMFLGGGDMFG